MKSVKTIYIVLFLSFFLASCQLAKMGGDAKENPPAATEGNGVPW